MAPAINVSKVGGNSLGLYLPKDFVEMLGVEKGDEFDFDFVEKHWDGSTEFKVYVRPHVNKGRIVNQEDYPDVAEEAFRAFYSALGIHPGMTEDDAMEALADSLSCGYDAVQETLHSNGIATHYQHNKSCTFDGTHCANCRKVFQFAGAVDLTTTAGNRSTATVAACCTKPELQDAIEPEECDMGYGCNAWSIKSPVHKLHFWPAFEAEAKKCWGDKYEEWLRPAHLMD